MMSSSFTITKNELIDKLGVILIFLLSSRDCLVRLFPSLPWNMLLILLFFSFIVSVVLKGERINYRPIIFFICVYSVIVVSFLVGTRLQREYISELFFDVFRFITLWLYLVVLSTVNKPERLINRLIPVAYCNMILLVITALGGYYSSATRSINYLGLGMNGMVWVSFIIQKAIDKDSKRKVLHIASAVVFSIFLMVYGNRGAAVAIAAFIIYSLIKYTSLKHKLSLCVFIAVIAGLISHFQQIIIVVLINLVGKFGITSRNLTLLLSGDLSYTTHRVDDIWVDCITFIKDSWLTGYGLCFDRTISGDISIYAHNIALEAWLSFGVIIGTILLIVHFSIGIRMMSRNVDDKWMKLFTPFYITSTVVLFFNSSFCGLASFWASYGIYFALLKNGQNIKRQFKLGGIK